MRLKPKGIYQHRKRRRLLPSTRIIKEEPWERLAPIRQHADERPIGHTIRREFLGHEGKSEAIKRGADQQLHVIDDEGSAHRRGQDFFPLSNSQR